MENIEQIRSELLTSIKAANDLDSIEKIRVASLGKKGHITQLMRGLGGLAPEEKKEQGKRLNVAKQEIQVAIEARRKEIENIQLREKLASEFIDVTLPARPEKNGFIHPISQTIEEVVALFADMGFEVKEGPDIEDDFHNFTALNIPEEHPARQMMDTFYIQGEESRSVLRTHTSPVQIRTMCNHEPPIRIVAPGRTYRCDYDITHTPMFHQIEGLVIDTKTTMAELKSCLIEFCRRFFEVNDLPVRFRSSHFPFTEPSVEVDIGCSRKGKQLTIGDGDDWLEILGAGMVHPNVLRNCSLDPEEYQGFAFGMGIERMAMLKYGIPDLRTFYESDCRWLKHYGFNPSDIPKTGGVRS